MILTRSRRHIRCRSERLVVHKMKSLVHIRLYSRANSILHAILWASDSVFGSRTPAQWGLASNPDVWFRWWIHLKAFFICMNSTTPQTKPAWTEPKAIRRRANQFSQLKIETWWLSYPNKRASLLSSDPGKSDPKTKPIMPVLNLLLFSKCHNQEWKIPQGCKSSWTLR